MAARGGGGGRGAGRGGARGRGAAASGRGAKAEGWRSKVLTSFDESGAKLIQLYDTIVVKITAADIIVDSGGFKTKQTFQIINETLQPHGWLLKVVNDEWYVSDGKYRMMKFADGLVISGAATEHAAPAAAASPASGAMRVVKPGGARFRPY